MSEKTPSSKREDDIGSALRRLGNSQTKDERYNNGFAHYSLAGPSAFIRALEERLSQLVRPIHVTILEAVPVKKENKDSAAGLAGKTITLDRSLFPNTMTLTKWIENFYQESPSINKIARDDQKEILTRAYGVPAVVGWQNWGVQEKGLEAD